MNLEAYTYRLWITLWVKKKITLGIILKDKISY